MGKIVLSRGAEYTNSFRQHSYHKDKCGKVEVESNWSKKDGCLVHKNKFGNVIGYSKGKKNRGNREWTHYDDNFNKIASSEVSLNIDEEGRFVETHKDIKGKILGKTSGNKDIDGIFDAWHTGIHYTEFLLSKYKSKNSELIKKLESPNPKKYGHSLSL